MCSGFEYPVDSVDRIPKSGIVLDVGANIGSFSVFASKCNEANDIHGWSIEPFASNVSLLRDNLRLNAVDFAIEELAISDHDGYCRIDTSLPPDEISVTTKVEGDVVRCVRLSTFCADRYIERVNLLKLDIEGHEYAVFESDRSFICECVDRVLLEWHRRPYGSREDIIFRFQDVFLITDIHRYRDGGVLLMENQSVIRS